jgi:hypothetical protein
MTKEQQHQRLMDMIEEHRKESTVTRQAARAALLREGYTSDGELIPDYGGKAIPSNE